MGILIQEMEKHFRNAFKNIDSMEGDIRQKCVHLFFVNT